MIELAAPAEGILGRALVLAAAAAAGGLLLGVYGLWRRRAPELERLDIDALDLELMAGCCALVVFTSPSCRPCKAALQIARGAAQRSPGTEVRTVDATQRPDLALRYEVRSIPTTFLVTASGHVVRRWRDVPDSGDVEAAVAAV